MEKEIWKDIEDYEGIYQISNFGNVKSLGNSGRNKRNQKILKLYKHTYLIVTLFGYNKKYKTKRVNRLVAKAFIPNPLNLPIVEHLDNNPYNNFYKNLMWSTYSHNTKYAYDCGRISKKGELNSMFGRKGLNNPSSIPIVQLTKKGEYIKEFCGIHEAERFTGIFNQNIVKCCKGKRHTAGGFKWEYKLNQNN